MAKAETTTPKVPHATGSGSSRSCSSTRTAVPWKRVRARSSISGEKSHATASTPVLLRSKTTNALLKTAWFERRPLPGGGFARVPAGPPVGTPAWVALRREQKAAGIRVLGEPDVDDFEPGPSWPVRGE